jgi:hypothetical protein
MQLKYNPYFARPILYFFSWYIIFLFTADLCIMQLFEIRCRPSCEQLITFFQSSYPYAIIWSMLSVVFNLTQLL